jgi:hypothetical protein
MECAARARPKHTATESAPPAAPASGRFALANFHSEILNRIKNIEAIIAARRFTQKRQLACISAIFRFTAQHDFGIHKHCICLAKSPKNQGFFQIADLALRGAHSG